MARSGSYDVQVQLGLPGKLESMLARAIGDVGAVFPNSLRAISALAEAAQRRWIAYASGELPLPNGHRMRRHTGQYAESIQIEVDTGDGYVRYVVYSDDPKAASLEWGTPAWDMHKLLYSSHKARISKKGHRYLVIPFRWGTPGTLAVGAYVGREMPQAVHTWWLQQDREDSWITGEYEEPSIQDENVKVRRFTYRWGDRLTPKDVEELGLDPNEGVGKRLVGMVRMRNPEFGFLRSEYMTFRTLSEANPEGWMHPGTPELGVARAVYEWVEQVYPSIMEQALEHDIEQLKKRVGNK